MIADTASDPAPDRVPAEQTTVRLFTQLQEQRYADADLRRARAACATAQVLFTGRMHWSGKPFLAHCIGAGSILAGLGSPADLIAAALLHAAYRLGDFGPWRPVPALRRRRLRRAHGARTEEYVYRCDRLRWDPATAEALSRRLPEDEIDRGAVLVRLACELDELRDRSTLYAADADSRREGVRRRGPALTAIAASLGFPALRDALATAIDETLRGEVAPELRSRIGRLSTVPPESAKRRLEAVVSSAIATALRRPGRAPGD